MLVRTNGDDAIISMVRAELHDGGWRIIEERDSAGGIGTESLARAVAAQSAAAALRFNVELKQIELRISRKAGDVEETLHSPGDTLDGRILALRTTETLRAHGLVLASEAVPTVPPPASAGPPRPQPKAPPAPQPKRLQSLWLDLGPAVIASSSGAPPGAGLWLGLRLELSPLWALQTTGYMPLVSHTVRGSEGSSRVATGLIGAALAATWLNRSLGSARAGLGYALLITSMKGDAGPNYVDRSELVVTQAPYGFMRFALAPHRNLECFLAMQGGISIPEVTVAFAEHTRETWGRPFLLAALGLSLRGLAW